MASVTFEDVVKAYGDDGAVAINRLNLDVRDGEFIVFVGPSGCGKSTALRMVAGLETVTGGDLRIGSASMNGVPPQDRDIAMVFQNYALYPHMTVYKNLEYPLRTAKVAKPVRKEMVEEIAKTLQLTELLERKPGQLSGGQRQRVAMGRALVRQPEVFLMDEPLSNLDAKLRVAMRSEISQIHGKLGVTTIYVTHDQVEAMTMGDRVAVLNLGELQQVDSPERLYNTPGNVFVAGFIGSPAMNLFTTVFTQNGDGSGTITLGDQSLSVGADVVHSFGLTRYNGKSVIAGIRPDDISDADNVTDSMTYSAHQCLNVEIHLREALGSEVICYFDAGVNRLSIHDDDVDENDIASKSQVLFSGRFSPTSNAQVGETRKIHFDVSKFHFFDPDTTNRLTPDA